MKSLLEVAVASVPTILSLIFFKFTELTNIFFMGHMDDTDLLGGVGLGAMLLNVGCYAFTMGLNGTLETYVS